MVRLDIVETDTNRDWMNSRPLDVYRWSDHLEVNVFVDAIYKAYFIDDAGNTTIRKKHIKVVLLDLYLCWYECPESHIAIHMRKSAYSNGIVTSKGNSRYNELHIKPTTIKVIHRLVKAGVIGIKTGFQHPDGHGRISRIWALPPLVKMFEDATFGYFDISYSSDREAIEQRDEDKIGSLLHGYPKF